MTEQELTPLERRRAVCPYTDCATGTVMDMVDQRMLAPESREYAFADFGEDGEGSLPVYPHSSWTQLPRVTASRASSGHDQRDSGTPLSAGSRQASAFTSTACKGVNEDGRPDR